MAAKIEAWGFFASPLRTRGLKTMLIYTRCLFIDYFCAIDTNNHDLLIRKLISLEMSSFDVRWIANFLTGRTQAVSSDGKLSSS